MGRWEPNARGRLEQAALELYGEHGFDRTTVKEIAERAGLTERTFFRHFADKREVLFPQSNPLQTTLVAALADAPGDAAPIDAVAAALAAAAPLFEERRELAARRQTVIDANAELRERELIKLASLGEALADGLRLRGTPEPAAGLAAEAGVAAFKAAFKEWIGDAGGPDLPQCLRRAFAELTAVVAGAERTAGR
ncbi:TetR/AcrR family transcriptional regulator [Nocardiopsis protaetiae]|uniref:TetR/AcrR family transcriptional regulator n=1 Tax=Nocardiopsis protaetiae TaxID=3382270 RepID=UPI00387AC9BE